MGVGVEMPGREQLREHLLGQPNGHVRRVDTEPAQCGDIADLDRGDVLQRQDAPGAALPDDLRRAGPRPVARGVPEVLPEGRRLRGFVQVVDLFVAGVREFLDQCGHIGASGDERDFRQPAGDLPQCGEVHLHDIGDAGALHLDDHIGVPRLSGEGGVEPRPVGLSQRRCGDRFRGEGRESARQRHPQVGLGLRPDRVEAHRGDIVLQRGEFLGDLRREHVDAGGHELADLDHQPAEVGRQPPEPQGGAGQALRLAPPAPGAQAQPGQHQVEPPDLQHHGQPEGHDAPVAGAEPVAAGAGGAHSPVFSGVSSADSSARMP